MLEVDTEEEVPGGTDGNLVLNPGFETGTLESWVGWGGAPREVIMAADAPSGDYVVHIVGGGAPEQIVAVEANTDYILGATARIPSGTVTLGIKPATINENIGMVVFDSIGWKRQEFTFNSGDNTELKFFFYAQAYAGACRRW